MSRFIVALFSLLLVFGSVCPGEALALKATHRPTPQPLASHQWVAANTNEAGTPVMAGIQISSPTSFQAFQKDKNNRQSMAITGTYTGNPTSITASFNGGKPQVIAVAPSRGGFSGTLKNQPAGQGELKIWFTNDPATSVTLKKIAITDIYVLIGQSNNMEADAGFLFSTPKTYTMPPQMGPVVYNLYAKLGGWHDAYRNCMYIVPFGQDYYEKHGYPCAFVLAAVVGSKIEAWQPNGSYKFQPKSYEDPIGAGMNLYNRAKKMVQTVSPAGVKAFLWHQGESDAGTALTAAEESSRLQAIGRYFNKDFPGVPMLVAKLQIIRYQSKVKIDTTAVQQGQVRAWNSLPNLLPGPDFSDLESDYQPELGAFHLMNDQNSNTVGHRWFKACVNAGIS